MDIQKVIKHGLNCEDAFNRALLQIFRKTPFYGHVARRFIKQWDDNFPTMGVRFKDGLIEMIVGAPFVTDIIDKAKTDVKAVDEIAAVIEHEILHVVFGHVLKKFPNHRAGNVAADMAVNSHIKRERLPQGAVFAEDFGFEKELGFNEYYDKLQQQSQNQNGGQSGQNGQQNQNGQQSQQGSGNGNGEDGEDENKGNGGGQNGEDENENQNGNGGDQNGEDEDENQQGSGNGNGEDEDANDGLPTINNHPWEKDEEVSGKSKDEVEDIMRQRQNELADVLNSAKRQMSSKDYGNLPAAIRNAVEEANVKPKKRIDWAKILKNFVASCQGSDLDQTMKKRSRRFGVRPGNKKEDTCRIYVGLDTSGSIPANFMGAFYDQLDQMLANATEEIIVGECDTDICDEYVYKGVRKKEYSGGGGTNMEPILAAAEKNRVDGCIVFTDMYAPQITKHYRVLVIFVSWSDNVEPIYKWGKVIKMELEEK